MLKSKRFIIIVFLVSLLAACQAKPINDQEGVPGPYPYPSPGNEVVGQDTAYPLPPDKPVTQETAYPSPGLGGNPSEPAYAPKPGDVKLESGLVFPNLADSGILLLESFPVQVTLSLNGELPTPCHQLRVKVSPPDAENRIQVEAYSVVDPGMMCTQVIKPFEAQINLGSFESGKYSVYVNGEFLATFTI
jgi:hypothetical protein